MITEQETKQAQLRIMADYFEVDKKELNECLHTVHAKYMAKLQEYEQCPEKDGHDEVLNKIASRSRSLHKALLDSPEYVKDMINLNTQIKYFSDAFLVTLKQLEDSVSNVEFNRYKGESGDYSTPLKRKPQLHQNNLVRYIAAAYTELTGRKANTGDKFHRFLDDACDYMDIDNTGLWARHKNKRVK